MAFGMANPHCVCEHDLQCCKLSHPPCVATNHGHTWRPVVLLEGRSPPWCICRADLWPPAGGIIAHTPLATATASALRKRCSHGGPVPRAATHGLHGSSMQRGSAQRTRQHTHAHGCKIHNNNTASISEYCVWPAHAPGAKMLLKLWCPGGRQRATRSIRHGAGPQAGGRCEAAAWPLLWPSQGPKWAPGNWACMSLRVLAACMYGCLGRGREGCNWQAGRSTTWAAGPSWRRHKRERPRRSRATAGPLRVATTKPAARA